MKNRHIILALLFLPTCLINTAFCQNSATNSGGQIATVQPKIMVIPYTKEGEDLRNVLENDENKRIAITKIKEAFDNRGFTTVDFVAKLKAAKDNNIFTSNNQTDIKSQIIQMSGADVYVQAEVIVEKGQSGNSVKLILSAYEASTGNSLSNKVGESGKFYTEDFNKLASKAVESCVEDFLNVIQAKFTEIVNNGKSVIIDISFDAGSQNKMSSEIGSDKLPLSDQIEMWMEKNAYKNNYHIQGTTDLKMIFDDVKIPLKDQSTGNNYNPNKFALELFKFFKGLGLQIAKDIKGNTIYITIK
jgi:predicted outer membrane repeat protein